MYFFLYILFFIPVYVSSNKAREVVERTGYGVNYIYVGDMYHHATTLFYPYTFALKLPVFQEYLIPKLVLSNITVRHANDIVRITNDMIDRLNTNYIRNIRQIRKRMSDLFVDFTYKTTLEAIYKANDEEFPTTETPVDTKKRRRKRQVVDDNNNNNDNNDDDLEQEAFDAIPKDIRKEAQQEAVINSLPVFQEGQIIGALGGLPTVKDMEDINKSIRQLALQAYKQVKQIIDMGKYTGTILSQQDSTIDQLEIEGDLLIQEYHFAQKELEKHSEKFAEDVDILSASYTFLRNFNLVLQKQIHPVYQKQTKILEIQRKIATRWVKGGLALMKGDPPYPYIITNDMLQEVIDTIDHKIENDPAFTNLIQPYGIPEYIAGFRKITTFVLTDTHLYILIKIPLQRRDISSGTEGGGVGTFKIYRAQTFPRPMNVGRSNVEQKIIDKEGPTDDGYVEVDIPEYLAVSGDASLYFDMSAADFITCTAIRRNQFLCGDSINFPRYRDFSSTDMTCIMAIYMDDAKAVKERCTRIYSKRPNPGSILHIYGTDRYLIQRDPKDTSFWELNCFQGANTRIAEKYDTFEQVEVSIPCGCSLYIKGSKTPRMETTSCIQNPIEYKVNFHHSLNTFMEAHYETNEEVLRNIMSTKKLLNEVFPPIHIPRINFSTEGLDEIFKGSLQRAKKIRGDLEKGLKLARNKALIYEKDIHEAANKTAEDAYTKEKEAGDIVDVLGSLLDIVGGDLGSFLAIAITPGFLLFVGCILCFLLYAPRVIRIIIKRIKRCFRNSKKKEDYILKENYEYESKCSLLYEKNPVYIYEDETFIPL